MIIDDRHLADLSRKGNPSQRELADRVCGHLSSHHPGGLSIFIAQQTTGGISHILVWATEHLVVDNSSTL
eukprot:SAG25_NODE_284_length_10400_cov_5.110475_14_plen_70_part_00